MDSNRNGIFDSLETLEGPVGVGLSYGRDVTDSDVTLLESMGYEITDVIEAVDAVLLGLSIHRTFGNYLKLKVW